MAYSLFAGTVPAVYSLFAGTLPAVFSLFACTVVHACNLFQIYKRANNSKWHINFSLFPVIKWKINFKILRRRKKSVYLIQTTKQIQ